MLANEEIRKDASVLTQWRSIQRSGRRWVDLEFPLHDAAYRLWKPSPYNQLFRGIPDVMDVLQACIGNCGLVSALACLAAADSAFIFDALPDQLQASKNGAYLVRLCVPPMSKHLGGRRKFHGYTRKHPSLSETCRNFRVDGTWRHVLVDDTFLRSDDDSLPLWPRVIEKALAKIAGGYEKLVGFESHETLFMLTGRPVEFVFWDPCARDNAAPILRSLLGSQTQFQDRIMVAGSTGKPAIRGLIMQDHDFSILGSTTMQTSQGRKTFIEMHCPHCGRVALDQKAFDAIMFHDVLEDYEHSGLDDGFFYIRLDKFHLLFKCLSICFTGKRPTQRRRGPRANWDGGTHDVWTLHGEARPNL